MFAVFDRTARKFTAHVPSIALFYTLYFLFRHGLIAVSAVCFHTKQQQQQQQQQQNKNKKEQN